MRFMPVPMGALLLLVALPNPCLSRSQSDDPEVRALASQVKRHDAPDSLRYRLAMLYSDSGEPELRMQALELLADIRRSYDGSAHYHADMALVLERSGRFLDARQSLARAVALDSNEPAFHVTLARIRLREMLYDFNLGLLPEIQGELGEALRLDPAHCEAQITRSLALHLAKQWLHADVVGLTAEGKAAALAVMETSPGDRQAQLLLAVHCVDLNEHELADETFRRFLEDAPEADRDDFALAALNALSAKAAEARNSAPAAAAQFEAAYWKDHDPSPATYLNEYQLEIWKRMAVADLMFSDPKRGLRGWNTAAGQVYVRYGPPNAHAFDPGVVSGDSYGGNAYKASLRVTPPSLTWAYRFPGLSFTVSFEDQALAGRWTAKPESKLRLEQLRSRAPMVFRDAPAGVIDHLYLATRSDVTETGAFVQRVALGISGWNGAGPEWWRTTRITLVLRDSANVQVAQVVRQLRDEHVYAPMPETQVCILNQEFSLAPGRYMVTVLAEDTRSQAYGANSWTVNVLNPGETSLAVGEVELTFPVDAQASGPVTHRLGHAFVTNPMRLVGDARKLDVYYTVFGLSAPDGEARYSTRYTVLPLSYVRDFDRMVRTGRARHGNPADLAAAGVAIGEVALGPNTWSDLKFPGEVLHHAAGTALPRGARIDVGRLDPGAYVLLVGITDLNTGRESVSQTVFQIVTDEGFRSDLAASTR